MEMKDVVGRALRSLDVPRDGGFEDVLAKLDKLKSCKPTAWRRDYLRQRLSASMKAPRSHVA